jgi:alkylated DNA nucleotide flippase Atl1
MDYASIALAAPSSRGSRRFGTCVAAMYKEQFSDWRRTAASVRKFSTATASEQISEIRRAQI